MIQTCNALNLKQMTHLLKIQNRFVCFVLTLLASCENWWCTGNCQLDHLQYPKTQPETKRATNLVLDVEYWQKIWSDKFYSEPCQVQYLGFHLGKKRTERRFHHICFCDFHLKIDDLIFRYIIHCHLGKRTKNITKITKKKA